MEENPSGLGGYPQHSHESGEMAPTFVDSDTPETEEALSMSETTEMTELQTPIEINEPSHDTPITRRRLGMKIAAGTAIASVFGGIGAFILVDNKDGSTRRSVQASSSTTNGALAREKLQEAIKPPHPAPEIPNSTDDNIRLQQIFTDLNNCYISGSTRYLDYAVSKGVASMRDFWAEDIQKTAESAKDWAPIWHEYRAPKRLDVSVLAINGTGTSDVRYLVEFTETMTLDKYGAKTMAPREFLFFTEPNPTAGAGAMGLSYQEDISDQPDLVSQIKNDPVVLSNL